MLALGETKLSGRGEIEVISVNRKLSSVVRSRARDMAVEQVAMD